MKRTRKIAFLLVTVLVMSLMSISAFAKGGKVNVPTAGEYYEWDYTDYKEDPVTGKWVPTSGKYVKEGSFTATYDKTGKIKSFTKYDVLGNVISKTTYKWKKDFIYKEAVVYNDYDYEGKWDENADVYVKEKASLTSSETGSSKYKFKGNKLNKTSSSYVRTYTSGSLPEYTNNTAKYSYNKNTAVGKVTDKVSGEKYYNVFEVTKKGQKKIQGATKYEYTKNGVLKKVTTTEKGTQANLSVKTTYDKYGYPKGYQYRYYHIDSQGRGITDTRSEVYTYVWGSKHCPSQIEWSNTHSSSTDTEPNRPSMYKLVVTGTKSVKQARNCDGFGRRVGLMAEY